MNLLSFDIEDWFQGFKTRNISGWEQFGSRVERNVDKVLNILDEYSIKATFFILGSVAKENPKVVKNIYDRGHEIGTHGYIHFTLNRFTPDEFRTDLVKSIKILEDICGIKVHGHRASAFSMTKETLWALDIMLEEGIKYDSSIAPSSLHRFGVPNCPAYPVKIILKGNKNIIEFPSQTLPILFEKMRLPIASGFYFRLFPAFVSKMALNYSIKNFAVSMLNLHPFEFDDFRPNIKIPFLYKINRYLNIEKTEMKFRNILKTHKFNSIDSFLKLKESELSIINIEKLKNSISDVD